MDNQNLREASVKGAFIFQKKGISDIWEDSKSIPLSNLKKGDSFKLELKSAELLQLFDELENLYQLFGTSGIPRKKTQYVKVDKSKAVEIISSLNDSEISDLITGNDQLGTQAVARLIRWATSAKNFSLIFERLESLESESLINLNAALGISTLKKAIKEWYENRHNSDEEYWQQLLVKHEFVIEQIFHIPIVLIKSKAYMGGKSVLNTGGKVVDFLIKNSVTKAVCLVEIKTPLTELLDSSDQYRNGIYNISRELSGAVMQVLNYKDSLSKESRLLIGTEAESFDPKCIVLIGNARNELDSDEKIKSFELFRRQLTDVEVITYDELYNRTKKLVTTLEGVVSSKQ